MNEHLSPHGAVPTVGPRSTPQSSSSSALTLTAHPVASIDPLLDPRLARLAARSAAARADKRPPEDSVSGPRQTAATGRTTPGSGTRRRHAAKGSRSAALALSAVSTLALAGYFQRADAADAGSGDFNSTAQAVDSSTAAVVANDSTDAVGSAAADQSSASASAIESTATEAAISTVEADATQAEAIEVVVQSQSSSSGLADGSFTGETYSNKWGPVQVSITVTGGEIVDVGILQYPDGDRKSVNINERALPTLIADTLSSQSANVDTVSGATYTSDDYSNSLQSAIDAALAASSN